MYVFLQTFWQELDITLGFCGITDINDVKGRGILLSSEEVSARLFLFDGPHETSRVVSLSKRLVTIDMESQRDN